ncbi:restriction endonuclease [Candidatus Gracilibacteria bacterium]|nr:restriction endonuclease [Candidatus Gracilibacteria bacterium]
MDIRKISLYLAGKLPPYYNQANPARFKRKVKEKFTNYIDDSQLDFIQKQSNQSEDLFFMILDDISKDYKDGEGYNSFINLLNDLEIPKEILGINEYGNYTWETFLNKVKSIYGNDFSTTDIGGYFEELCKELLIKDGFINVKVAGSGSDGGIDITADKEIFIGNNTKKLISFVGQCKYKSSGNVTKEEVNALLTPIINDTNNMFQGILFFTNQKYQPNAKQELENTQSSRINLKSFYLDGNEILDIINSHFDLIKKFS